MKAVVQDTYGPPSVLRVEETARPVPGPGEVLVRVHAAAVDQGVWHLMAGMPYLLRGLGFGLRAPRDRVRGTDLAGRVEAVGPGVTGFAPGDEVYGSGAGTFAEYARAKAAHLAPKPRRLGFEEAATVPVSACTALQALRDSGRLRAGQHVLVIGASGGVGSYAVQLAKALGAAHVTGVCGTAKTAFVRSLGADEVVDHTQDDPTDGARRYDLVLDIAGNRRLSLLRRALTPDGTLVIVGGEHGGRWTGGIGRQLRGLLLSSVVRHRIRTLVATQPAADLERLSELVDAGAVVPAVDRVYPSLGDAAEAVRRLRAGEVRGKL
ncbi:NAD(P)-dependent alcohol dehydrogenase, partial [Streptomyces sp. NPDC088732]|uniref:NAD(P)-dependent alcohol dehydrogenase n=1 Tax=Streptomyces sp. NPDC088732 TaxID=3365879 RepID=UPI00381B9DFA